MRRFEVKVVRFVAAMAMIASLGSVFISSRAIAQTTLGPGSAAFKDTSAFKPPAGAKVAILEFYDLQCPACAHAFPIIQQAVAHYNIPWVEKDFPLPQHQVLGSLDAAVWARYLQDKVSPKLANEYRGAVFAAQAGITNKEDMLAFTRRFFQSHGQQMPFVADPTGELMKQVQADKALGNRVGVDQTPTIIVCSQREWIHVTDVSLLYQAIDQVMARAGATAAPTKTAAAKKSADRTSSAH